MTAVRPEGRYQSGADPHRDGPYRGGQYEGGQYEGGQYGGGPQQGDPYGGFPSEGGRYGHAQGQGDPYGSARPGFGGPGPDGSHPDGRSLPQDRYQPHEPYPTQQLPAQNGAEDGWGVYEQVQQPQRPHAPGQDGPDGADDAPGPPEYPWLADQTLQLRVPPPAAGADQPPTGGRAERRRAAQGRMAVRSGGGRRRASGRAAGGAPRPKESVAVVAARFVGELCITLGVVMLLFVSYQLWWTNVQADAAADGARNQLEQQFDAGQPAPGVPGQPAPDPAKPETFEPGKGFAIIHLPKLGLKFPIAEGTSKSAVLDKGLVGHYTGTGMPADKAGNFALAAHRNTHGEPFRHINQLTKGDKIVVETATAYYTYEITGGIPETPPSNVSVIKPVPNGSGYSQAGRYITLTTCTPEFSSKARLIVFGKMIEERPRSQGKPAGLTVG
ncbi:class E sortase [Kitasatospora sp. NPDC127111]|uniref:class E sortase n=1 Tax=Kitasatospora sp. NPDC127111 TaxID=3345363 RepID=UPI0036419290